MQIYLFREAGGTMTSNWFTLSKGPAYGGFNFQDADSAMRDVWEREGQGYEIVTQNVPLREFEEAFHGTYRELDSRDLGQLIAARLRLEEIFGSKKEYLDRLRNFAERNNATDYVV